MSVCVTETAWTRAAGMGLSHVPDRDGDEPEAEEPAI